MARIFSVLRHENDVHELPDWIMTPQAYWCHTHISPDIRHEDKEDSIQSARDYFKDEGVMYRYLEYADKNRNLLHDFLHKIMTYVEADVKYEYFYFKGFETWTANLDDGRHHFDQYEHIEIPLAVFINTIQSKITKQIIEQCGYGSPTLERFLLAMDRPKFEIWDELVRSADIVESVEIRRIAYAKNGDEISNLVTSKQRDFEPLPEKMNGRKVHRSIIKKVTTVTEYLNENHK